MKTDAFEVPKIGKKMQKRGVLLSEKGGTTVRKGGYYCQMAFKKYR